MTKKLVENWIYSDITGCTTLGEIRDLVFSMIELHGSDTEICFDSGYNNIDESIKTWREETEEEYQKRLKQEARERELIVKQEEKERREYERLKKKFS